MPLKLNQDELPTINLTSMIDVLFLLIIFFMVVTRFTENELNIKINLAKVAPNGAMLQGPPSKLVYIAADGTIQYENQRVTSEQLASLLSQAVKNYPETSVQVRPDAAAQWEPIASTYMAIKKSGARLDGFANASVQMPTQRR